MSSSTLPNGVPAARPDFILALIPHEIHATYSQGPNYSFLLKARWAHRGWMGHRQKQEQNSLQVIFLFMLSTHTHTHTHTEQRSIGNLVSSHIVFFE